jgi:hypothetical protein
LLSNRLLILLAAFAAFVFISCGEGDSGEPQANWQSNDYSLKRAKEILGENVKFAYSGYFTKDSVLSLAAGVEIADDKSWGIRFYLFEIDDKELSQVFESEMYDGSFNESLIKKIKFPDFDYELIYYNSQDYFMGSGGGEIFSYIVDYDLKRIYYAHLVTESESKISLFISENTEIPVIKNFFIGNFKRDYPSFTMLSEDIKLDF